MATQPCPALASGESYSSAFASEPCPCGQTLTVKICADNDNVVAESDETNNCEENIVECPGVPDLVVSKSVTIEDNTFTVSYTVTNQGCGPAVASTTCKYIDGVLMATQPCPALASGGSYSGSFDPEPCPCSQTITVIICADNYDDFLEHVRLDMFADQVFCFTPKGAVIALPRGATPIDFAYAIHTRIGAACVGAKVDNRRVPLWTRLRNGQSVEITTAEGQRPQPTWIDIAVTGRAKSAIRRALRDEHKEGFIRLGRELARVALEHVGKKASDTALRTAAKNLGLSGAQELRRLEPVVMP